MTWQIARLSQVIGAIQETENRQALAASVRDGARLFGFADFCIAINIRDKRELLAPTLGGADTRFLDDYDRYGFIQIDPVMANAVATDRPFSWTSYWAWRDRQEAELAEYLRALPEKRGVILPLPHMPGRVSTATFLSSPDLRCDEETVHCLSIIATAAMIKAEGLGLCADDRAARLGDAGLSPRQIEVLHWAAQGKSNADIATITGQSKRAVDYHRGEILRKLRVTTRSQAIALLAKGAL